jgi:putative hemolysin
VRCFFFGQAKRGCELVDEFYDAAVSGADAQRGIVNERSRRCSEQGGRLHPFLRQSETALAIFLIFEG